MENTATMATVDMSGATAQAASGAARNVASSSSSSSSSPDKTASSATSSGPHSFSKPGGSDNVFSLMAKKIKGLELNQSMFDRYIEALNSRYADRFEDLTGDVSDLDDRVANSTAVAAAALRLAEDRAAETAGTCDSAVKA